MKGPIDYLMDIALEKQGGAGDTPTGTIEITENGNYNVSPFARAEVSVPGSSASGEIELTENGRFNVAQYEEAVVAVPGVTPSGSITLTENGEADVSRYASAVVAVPGPSGSVDITTNGTFDVSDAAQAVVAVPGIVPEGSLEIDENGTYDVTAKAEVVVDVAGSGSTDTLTELLKGTLEEYSTNEAIVFDSSGTLPFFNTQKGLKKVNMPNATGTLRNQFFESCLLLQEVNMPLVIGLSSSAFYSCNSLVTCNMPAVQSIPQGAFLSCSSLTEYTFTPKSGSSIARNGFVSCRKLSKLVLLGQNFCSLAAAVNATFLNTPIESGEGYVYVDDSLVDTYKTATNWSTIADQIKPLSELEE